MIQFSHADLLKLGRGKASEGKYEDALQMTDDINTPEARRLRAVWSYQFGKHLVSTGSHSEARKSFAVAIQHHAQASVHSLAQKRNELLNRILNGETQSVAVTNLLETINISEATALPPETFAPLISFVGCPAAYRSGFDRLRSDPLSTFIRTVKRESSGPVVADERIRAIARIGDFLAEYAYAKTTLLRGGDLLVPIPTDKNRFAKRGYSVPLILAARVSVRCAIPLYTNLIEPTGPLQELRAVPRWARSAAVQDAFAGTRKATMLNNLNAIIVDDVVTTGSTIREAAMVLRECGCRSVSALVLAHTEWSG